MRSVWTGSIRLGLANIPVRAYSATEDQGGTGLNQVHLADGGRIRHRRVCEVDGTDVALADVAKGYVMPGGEVVVLTDDDFAKLPLPTSRAIEIQSFAPAGEIDPIYFARSYHLEPSQAGVKAYVLFSEALQQSGKVAIVKVALRQRENLGVLRIRDQVIVLEDRTVARRGAPARLPVPAPGRRHRRAGAARGVRADRRAERQFTAGRYTDRYREALAELVQAKIDGNELVQPAAAAQSEGAADLLGALRTSVAARQVETARAAEAKAAEAKDAAKKAARTRPKART